MHKINYFFKAAKIAVKKISPAIMIISFVASGFVYSIPPAQAALQAVSTNALGAVSVNTATGFPVWYQDVTGAALQQCLGLNADGTGAADPKCVLPGFATVPNIGADPTTFPDESFYFFAEAPLTINGNAGRFRLLTEAAFASGVPVNGQQITFARASLFTSQAGAFPPNSSFHVEYPFGAFDFSTDATGGMLASAPTAVFQPNGGGGGGAKEMRAEDGPGAALDFTTILTGINTGITTFLRSTTAPAGYLGDAVSETPVTGGTNGNVVTITQTAGAGPFVVTGGTNWIVAGKIAVIDTVAPTIVSVIPSSAVLGSTNVVARANITDNLGATSATIDLGSLGSNLSATLNGSQEVPPIGSTATGAGAFTIDTTANTLSFNINFSGLPAGDIEATSHIHNAAVGVNGPIVFDLPVGTSKIGVWNYPEALEAEILAGRTYAQIHSVLFPAGAIRGQILPNANIQNMILTAGTKTDGTWSVIIPGALSRLGTFNLPIVVSDGSNTANGALTLTVNVLTSVSVAPVAASLAIGGIQQLTASPLDETGGPFTGATVSWVSSNNGVATVDANGLVTAVAPGIATITATAVSGAITKTASSNITVASVAPVFTSISVSPATGSAAIGGTLQLTAQALDQAGAPMIPQPIITWASGDSLIATVTQAGLVSGIAAGGPIAITATSGLISGSSNITVSAAPVCQTAADTNLDGAIGNLEMLNYLRDWKAGSVTNLLMLRALVFWKIGVGC